MPAAVGPPYCVMMVSRSAVNGLVTTVVSVPTRSQSPWLSTFRRSHVVRTTLEPCSTATVPHRGINLVMHSHSHSARVRVQNCVRSTSHHGVQQN